MGRDDRESGGQGGQVVPEQAGAEHSVSRHFEEARLEHNLDLFDFGLDTPLKKIRQIWKANLPVVEVQELRRSLVAANSGDSCNTSGTLMNSDF